MEQKINSEATEKFFKLLHKLESKYGTIYREDKRIEWLNVYKALKAGKRDELLDLGFTDEELEMAKAYNTLYKEGCILENGGIDLEVATINNAKECILCGVDEELVNEWVAYWNKVEDQVIEHLDEA